MLYVWRIRRSQNSGDYQERAMVHDEISTDESTQ